MTIVFEAENANEEFLKVVKDIAKLANIKLKTQKKRVPHKKLCKNQKKESMKHLRILMLIKRL